MQIDDLRILLLGDLHVGHRCFDQKMFERYLSKADADTHVLLLGDLFEAGTRKSPGRPADQIWSVSEQRKYLQTQLEPFRGRIDAAVGGNHEERIPNEGGDDITAVLCELLGVRYLGYAGMVQYTTEKARHCAYTVAVRHGSTGAFLPGGALNAAQRHLWNSLADIYLSGHVHKVAVSTNVIQVPDPANSSLNERHQYIVTNGALLNAKGSYAELKGYPVAIPCQVTLTLSMRRDARGVSVTWN